MIISLSGFSGTGKSTILEKIKKERNDFCFSDESAREILSLQNFYIKDNEYLFFQENIMHSEFSKLNFLVGNNIKKCFLDRNIIDNISYAQLRLNNDKKVENILHDSISKFLDNHSIDFIYDKIFFIKSNFTNKEELNIILKDKIRSEFDGADSKKFIDDSIKWEDIFFYNLEKFSYIYNEIIILEDSSKYEENYKEIINSIS